MAQKDNGRPMTFNLVKLGMLVVAVIAAAAFVTGYVPNANAGDHDEKFIRITDIDEDSAYLGVQITEEVDNPDGGAKIVKVVDGSPAEKAGLLDGDIIVKIDKDPVRGPGGLTRRLGEREPGDNVEITVVRDGDRVKLGVELGKRTHTGLGAYFLRDGKLESLGEHDEEALEEYRLKVEEWSERYGDKWKEFSHQLEGMDWPGDVEIRSFFGPGRPRLGVQLVDVTPELREHLGSTGDAGVLVSKVLSDTPAEEAGVLVGDLIIAAGGRPVEDAGDLVRALRGMDGETIELQVIRDGRKMQIDAFIPEREEDEATGPRAYLFESMPEMPPMPDLPALPAMPELLALPELESLGEKLENLYIPEESLEIRRSIEEALREAQQVNRETLRMRALEQDLLRAEMEEARQAQTEEFLIAREDYRKALEEAREAARMAREEELLLREDLEEDARKSRFLEI